MDAETLARWAALPRPAIEKLIKHYQGSAAIKLIEIEDHKIRIERALASAQANQATASQLEALLREREEQEERDGILDNR
jgi:hypothetical protein